MFGNMAVPQSYGKDPRSKALYVTFMKSVAAVDEAVLHAAKLGYEGVYMYPDSWELATRAQQVPGRRYFPQIYDRVREVWKMRKPGEVYGGMPLSQVEAKLMETGMMERPQPVQAEVVYEQPSDEIESAPVTLSRRAVTVSPVLGVVILLLALRGLLK